MTLNPSFMWSLDVFLVSVSPLISSFEFKNLLFRFLDFEPILLSGFTGYTCCFHSTVLNLHHLSRNYSVTLQSEYPNSTCSFRMYLPTPFNVYTLPSTIISTSLSCYLKDKDLNYIASVQLHLSLSCLYESGLSSVKSLDFSPSPITSITVSNSETVNDNKLPNTTIDRTVETFVAATCSRDLFDLNDKDAQTKLVARNKAKQLRIKKSMRIEGDSVGDLPPPIFFNHYG
ncbi:hypothetical protein P9112_002169 [Eukaryota sp. TZLM1-RC]